MCDSGNGTFIEYDQLANLEIETAYLANLSSVALTLTDESSSARYAHTSEVKIVFEKMVETDLQTGNQRLVRRSDYSTKNIGKSI